MAKKPAGSNTLLSSLRRLADGTLGAPRDPAVGPPDSELMRLREWQAGRLAITYADLLQSQEFGPACEFFLEEIYAARDFRQRDHDAEHAYQVMKRFLPIGMLQTLSLVLQLNELTAQLDSDLLAVLKEEPGYQVITPTLYAEAYRRCNNYAERKLQIDLLLEVGQGVKRLVALPFVGAVLRLARRPARRAGWSALQHFLENGFQAFSQMEDVDQFLDIIDVRERLILDRIFQDHPAPFDIGNSIEQPAQ